MHALSQRLGIDGHALNMYGSTLSWLLPGGWPCVPQPSLVLVAVFSQQSSQTELTTIGQRVPAGTRHPGAVCIRYAA